jgi:hypothetical protein
MWRKPLQIYKRVKSNYSVMYSKGKGKFALYEGKAIIWMKTREESKQSVW